MSVLSHLAMARGWYGVPCEAPGGKLPCASGTYSPQEAGTRRPHVQYGGPGAYASTQACAWRWPPNPNPSPNQGGALTVLVHFARASFCVTYSTSAMPLAIFCSWYTHSETHEMNFLSFFLPSSAKAGARLAKARPAATSGTARRVHMAAERGAGAIIFRPEAQAAKRRSASSLEPMIARAMGCAKPAPICRKFGGGIKTPARRE